MNLVRLNVLAPEVALELVMFDGKEQAVALMKEYYEKRARNAAEVAQ